MLEIKDPFEAKLCLQHVEEFHRHQNKESPIGDTHEGYDLLDKQNVSENGGAVGSRKSFRGYDLKVPMPIPFLREADQPLLLVYGALREIQYHSAKRRFKCVTQPGFVACSARPHDQDVTYNWLRKCYNTVANGSCLFPDDLEAYMAFFPTRSFMELPYCLFQVGNHKFFSVPPLSEFFCEVVAIGWGFPRHSKDRVQKPVASKPGRCLPWCFGGM
ncbi:hypothetical protein G6M86_27770 (plasmid) [Agrobacterium tumefaciens]|uniref:Cytokinin glycosidase domain-containing protein n=2 Tax=Agrobacterium tumefaciens TaxID=358 RepID=A0AAJ4N9A3_AGRTU|nr:hypothetical protein G6M86_27770 [Agrobacterium tumefaciens]